jgi:phosphohistidine phosphatase
MKTLYIVRHAKSSWDYPELDDMDRPLNNRGKRNAPEMGKRLAKQHIKPGLLVTSPAKRARATAKNIAKEIGISPGEIVRNDLLYHGSISSILEVISTTDDHLDDMMIVGHNPGFTELANYLTGSDIYNIPTCGVVAIEFDVESWNEIGEKTGKLLFFDYPKNAPKV